MVQYGQQHHPRRWHDQLHWDGMPGDAHDRCCLCVTHTHTRTHTHTHAPCTLFSFAVYNDHRGCHLLSSCMYGKCAPCGLGNLYTNALTLSTPTYTHFLLQFANITGDATCIGGCDEIVYRGCEWVASCKVRLLLTASKDVHACSHMLTPPHTPTLPHHPAFTALHKRRQGATITGDANCNEKGCHVSCSLRFGGLCTHVCCPCTHTHPPRHHTSPGRMQQLLETPPAVRALVK